jgi:WD40 repeat protein/serine/threonine protein kinase
LPADHSRDYDLIDRLADDFAARYRRGERPTLQEYVDRYPHLAADIRDMLPAMVEIEQVKEDLGDDAPAPPPPLKQLGDFHILREVGHGGMGVVYEAEQVSLGRRVALKVLSQKTLRDAKQRRRFEREARAAAKLHHTNIVPVFGVGETDGTPYYVMQFIQGLGLDEVIDELSRIGSGTPAPGAEPRPGRTATARAVARSLMTGAFQARSNRANGTAAAPTIDGPGAAPSGEPGASATGGLSCASENPPVANPPGSPSPAEQPLSGSGHATRRRSDTSGLSSSVTLPGQSESGPGRKSKRLTYWQSVARVGVQVAEALEHAHGQGIIHRDVKPSNLLLDLEGTVWVTDFGLAKADDHQNLTHTGDILGTLRYMPPEAFEGHADARGDVYGLGLTLYELLALRPAFQESDRHRLIKAVTQEEPPPLRKVRPDMPRDLETIVHKAIDKAPAHRYQTAGDLAADLQRFIDDEPIQARRLSAPERAWRWCRRNPAVASLLTAVAALLVGVTVASLWAATHFERTAANERTARQQADAARRARERMLTDMYTSFGLAAGNRDDPRQAVLWFAHAARLAGDDRERADANRTRAAAWGRLAIVPMRAFVHPAEWVENNMAFHPGGRHFLTHGYHPAAEETDCRLWDLEREEALPFPGNPGVVTTAAWDATGERLAVGIPQGEVTICRFPAGQVLQRMPFAGRIARVLFSPDGRYCALAADNRARVWDCWQAAFATPELEHPAPVSTLAFHPRGELLATGCKDNSCRVFAVPAEKSVPVFAPVSHVWGGARRLGVTPLPPLFLDEGRGLLTLSGREASWRDARTGRVLRKLPCGESSMRLINTTTLSTDGKYAVLPGLGPDRQHARIYDVGSAQPVGLNLEHRAQNRILAAAFSPDRQTLLTGGADRTARLWSVPEGKPLGGPLAHPMSVSGVAFTPDGRHKATAQRYGLIRLWVLPTGNPHDYRVPVGSPSFVRFSRDGRFLLPAGRSAGGCELQTTQVFNLTTGERAGPPLEANGFILDAAFSPDGLQVAAAISLAASSAERKARQGQQPGELQLWDWRAGKLRHEPLPLPSEPRMLDYSPDGRHLAVIGAKGELVVIGAAAGKGLRRWQAHPPQLENGQWINNGAVRFGPDGRSLLTFGTDTNSARVWDGLTGQLRHELKHEEGRCLGVQFSPDGRLVTTTGWDNRVYVWELATGARLASLAHPDMTYTAPFSPDGRHLLTGCRDGMARLWDWRAGRLVHSFEHEHEVHAVAFTPDGRHVLSASDDGVLKVWEWRTGKLVCPPFALGGAGLSLAVTPDGKRVAVGGFMKELPVFHLDDWLMPPPLGPDDLCLWGEIVSGQRIEDGGGVTNLTAEDWLQRWRDFRGRHPDWAAAP